MYFTMLYIIRTKTNINVEKQILVLFIHISLNISILYKSYINQFFIKIMNIYEYINMNI